MLDGVGGITDALAQQLCKNSDRRTDANWIELLQMMSAFRRPQSRKACSDSATSTPQTTQPDQSKHTWSGDFNEAHTDVIESNVVAAIDTHSDMSNVPPVTNPWNRSVNEASNSTYSSSTTSPF